MLTQANVQSTIKTFLLPRDHLHMYMYYWSRQQNNQVLWSTVCCANPQNKTYLYNWNNTHAFTFVFGFFLLIAQLILLKRKIHLRIVWLDLLQTLSRFMIPLCMNQRLTFVLSIKIKCIVKSDNYACLIFVVIASLRNMQKFILSFILNTSKVINIFM